MLSAKVNCECLTPAVVLDALRDVESRHLSPAAPGGRTLLPQGLIASQTGHIRSSELSEQRLGSGTHNSILRVVGWNPLKAEQN